MIAGYISWTEMRRVVDRYGKVAVWSMDAPTREEKERVFDIFWIESSYHGMKIHTEVLSDGSVRFWATPRPNA